MMTRDGRTPDQAINPQSAREAVAWLTQLMSEDVSREDKDNWQHWLAASPENQQAWQHIAAFSSRFTLLHDAAAHRTLSTVPDPQRRRLLRSLAGIGLVGATGIGAGLLSQPAWLADYRTATGEQRQIALDDGTHLLLNTQTAVNVSLPQINLLQGEMLVTSPPAGYPLILPLPQGRVLAHNSRFGIRQWDDYSEVAVYRGRINVLPDNGMPGVTVKAGDSGRLGHSGYDPAQRVHEEPGWQRGMLMADNMRLDDFLAELGRYRRGVIRCSSEVAGLRLSGAFPLNDTDRIIASLPGTLPVRVESVSKYYISIS